jgi:hypothetical protein
MGNGVMLSRSGGHLYLGHTGSSGTAALIDQTQGLVGFLATNVLAEKMTMMKPLSRLMASVGSSRTQS